MIVPYVVERLAGGGERALDVYSRLLADRIVYLGSAIDDDVADVVVAQLLHLESAQPDMPIDLYVNSPGGSPSAMLAIYDAMQYVRSPVFTMCVGQASADAAVLVAGGAAGSRAILRHARMVLHQPGTQARGDVPDLILAADEIVRVRAELEEVLSTHTGKDVATLRRDTDRELVLTAEQAVAYGLADRVIVGREGALRRAGEDDGRRGTPGRTATPGRPGDPSGCEEQDVSLDGVPCVDAGHRLRRGDRPQLADLGDPGRAGGDRPAPTVGRGEVTSHPQREVGQRAAQSLGHGAEHLRRRLLATPLHLGEVLHGHAGPLGHVGQPQPLVRPPVPQHAADGEPPRRPSGADPHQVGPVPLLSTAGPRRHVATLTAAVPRVPSFGRQQIAPRGTAPRRHDATTDPRLNGRCAGAPSRTRTSRARAARTPRRASAAGRCWCR